MPNTQNQWTEDDSQLYQKIAPVAVPARAEQLATLLTLLPFGREDTFRAVEVGSGEGILSELVLTCFPQATVLALDGSEEMQAQTHRRLRQFGPRANVKAFELMSNEWHIHLRNADCALSSLVIHHLFGEDKRALFRIIHDHLSNRGALLIADLIAPQRPEAQSLFAATWDAVTKAQSIDETGSTDLFETFKQVEWNTYRYPDPADRPSPLFDQLLWLKEVGFTVIDCFWLQAGHAIYGGYKSTVGASSERLAFEDALQVVQEKLG